MLKKRIIPKLLLTKKFMGNKERHIIVTTKGFQNPSIVGDPVSQAKVYESQAADELLFVDIEASKENRTVSFDLVKQLAGELFMPFTVGGGVRTLEHFRELLKSGADKVCIDTSAIENPKLITEAAKVFGAQCVVVSIDYRGNSVFGRSGQLDGKMDVVTWAKKCESLGAGEIILTSIERDGTRSGLDLKTLSLVTSAVNVPVIASGGCGTTKHFIEGFLEGGAEAVSSGTFFAFKDENPIQTRAHIKNAGISIR